MEPTDSTSWPRASKTSHQETRGGTALLNLTAAASPAYELSQNCNNKLSKQGNELDSFDTLNFFPTSLRATVPLSRDTTQNMITVPKQISLSQFANHKYDPDDSAFEGCSSVHTTTTISGCYDVTSADVWVKRSLSFEEEDESIDSGFGSRTSTRTLYLKSTYRICRKQGACSFYSAPLFSADLQKFLLRSTEIYELFVSDLLESFLVLIQFCN